MSDKSLDSVIDVEEVPPDPLIGKVLKGRFRIVEKLGAGGMGTVYKAMQAPLDRAVAVKILNTAYGAGKDPGFKARFELEAKVTSKLSHPNTITVIDYGEAEEGLFFIAMEYLHGRTLSQVLSQEGPLPWQRALNIVAQVCRALREAHGAGVIHRDLKPANVMILSAERDHDVVKVLDFGLVKTFQTEQQEKNLSDTELTQAGMFLGSPQYMAPEQAKNRASPQSDIYSVGVMLYQMLTGEPPFRGQQSIDVIVKHLNTMPPPLRTKKPDYEAPSEVDALVMRCLEKRPEDRWPSMDHLLEAIRQCGGTAASGVFSNSGLMSPPRPLPPLPQRTKSNPTLSMRPAPSGVNSAVRSAGRSPSGATTQGIPFYARRGVIPALIFVGAIGLGGGAVLLLAGGGSGPEPVVAQPVAEAPAAVTPEPAVASARPETDVHPAAATEPAAAEAVSFRIQSIPSGAEVFQGSRRLGQTPLTVEAVPDADGQLAAELTFALDGYQRATVTASGKAPGASYTHRLVKKPAAPKKTVAPGYKDDPYQ